MGKVLLCGDEFHASLAGVRGLRAGAHVPYLAVCRSHTYASYSRSTAATLELPDPDFDPVAFATAVGEAAVGFGVSAILPGTESALVVLSHHTDALPTGIALGAPPASTVEAAVDKSNVVEVAERAGLRLPPTRTVTREELLSDATDLHYPLILKPVRSKLPTADETLRYVKVRWVETANDLQQIFHDLPDGQWIVQPGLEARLSAIGGVAWDGDLVCAVHQVSHRIWPPRIGFSSYARTVPPDPELEETVRRLLAELGWSGIFELQFIDTRDERYFIDFNPRLYGSIALAIAAGQNLPSIWADLVLGREPKVSGYRSGVRYRLEPNDVRAIGRLVTTGAVRDGLRAVLPHRHTAHGIFSLRDPGPVRTLLIKGALRARLDFLEAPDRKVHAKRKR